jgi:hypothetical protein
MSETSTRRRARRLLRAAGPTAGAALAATLAVAAFTDEAANSGNRATAASVTITEDVPASSPLFDLTDWQPGEDGDTVARCIGITNAGSIPVPLALRFAGAPAGRLGEHIDMRIERGTRSRAADDGSCATFASDATTPVVYEGEVGDFPSTDAGAVGDRGAPLAVGAERAYRVIWRLQDTEEAEGQSISGVTFRWSSTSAG